MSPKTYVYIDTTRNCLKIDYSYQTCTRINTFIQIVYKTFLKAGPAISMYYIILYPHLMFFFYAIAWFSNDT